MDRFLLMQCFVRAVETGSFSAVGRELGIGQPNVSRHVAGLESYLGTRLLHRSTRKLTLTPEGEHYYAQARRLLDAMVEAESSVRGRDTVRGLLRVACPTVLGRSHLLPLVKPLLDRYPELELDVQISDRFIDLVEEGVDAAIRIGILRDSAMKARRIGTAERICVATPAYLAEHGAPIVPADLEHHDCVLYTLAAAGNVWSFRHDDVAVRGRFRVNSPDGVRSAVLDGLGIAYAPVWLFDDALRDGHVQPLLIDHLGTGAPINLLYSAKRLLSKRAMVFMDFVAASFSGDRNLNEGAVTALLGTRTGKPAARSGASSRQTRPSKARR